MQISKRTGASGSGITFTSDIATRLSSDPVGREVLVDEETLTVYHSDATQSRWLKGGTLVEVSSVGAAICTDQDDYYKHDERTVLYAEHDYASGRPKLSLKDLITGNYISAAIINYAEDANELPYGDAEISMSHGYTISTLNNGASDTLTRLPGHQIVPLVRDNNLGCGVGASGMDVFGEVFKG